VADSISAHSSSPGDAQHIAWDLRRLAPAADALHVAVLRHECLLIRLREALDAQARRHQGEEGPIVGHEIASLCMHLRDRLAATPADDKEGPDGEAEA
jgi:hypothetical protein